MDIKDIIKGFEMPERKYSAIAFWFWNGGGILILAWQIDEMVDKGGIWWLYARSSLFKGAIEEVGGGL